MFLSFYFFSISDSDIPSMIVCIYIWLHPTPPPSWCSWQIFSDIKGNFRKKLFNNCAIMSIFLGSMLFNYLRLYYLLALDVYIKHIVSLLMVKLWYDIGYISACAFLMLWLTIICFYGEQVDLSCLRHEKLLNFSYFSLKTVMLFVIWIYFHCFLN